jgi:hypothetical protein
MRFLRPPLGDPAAEAARFLQRLAFIILMIAAPCTEVLSHSALYVLLPVGAGILIVAGLVSGALRTPRRFIASVASPVAVAVGFLAFWAALSLAWTLFPVDAAERLGRTLLTGGIAMLAILAQPERTKISNLYLLPIGVALTAAATLLMVLFGSSTFWLGANPDYTFAQRCVMSIAVLVWPAIGALALREHFIIAASLALLVFATVLAAFLQVGLGALMAAAVVYVAATSNPGRTAKMTGYAVSIVFLGAPLAVVLLYAVAIRTHLALFAPHALGHANPIVVFSELVVHQWPRFITGHGLNSAQSAIDIGLLPQDAPRSIIFTLWYELGVVGVAGFAFLTMTVLVAAGNASALAAPAILAALVAGLVIAVFGTETTQLWWLTLNAIAAIALGLLARAHPAAKRPPAPAADDEDRDWEEMEDPFDVYGMPESTPKRGSDQMKTFRR